MRGCKKGEGIAEGGATWRHSFARLGDAMAWAAATAAAAAAAAAMENSEGGPS